MMSFIGHIIHFSFIRNGQKTSKKSFKMIKVLFFLAAISASLAQFNPVPGLEDCGSQGALHGVWMTTDCTTGTCLIFPDNEYTVRVEFTTAASHAQMRLVVSAIIAGIPIPLLEEIFDGPFQGGQRYQLDYTVSVSDRFAGLSITIQAQVTGEFCARVPIAVGNNKMVPQVSNARVIRV